jgi:hypothetical protein
VSDNLKSILEESSLSQMLITVIIMVGAIAIQLVQGAIPQWVEFVVIALVGFYFGAKSNSLTNKVATVLKDVAAGAGSAPVSGSVTTVTTTAIDAKLPVSTQTPAPAYGTVSISTDKVSLPAQVIGNDGSVATINPIKGDE